LSSLGAKNTFKS